MVLVVALLAISFCLQGSESLTKAETRECSLMERFSSDVEQRSGTIQQRIVQVPVHESAFLHCAIPHLKENIVAWTRLRDKALLTAGEKSFTTDSRFQILHKASELDWILIIRRAERSDSGCYLCEVNTEPTSTVYAVYLNVIETRKLKASSSPSAKRTTNLVANLIGNEVLLNCTLTTDGETNISTAAVEWCRDGQPIDLKNTKKYISKVKRDGRTIVHILRILSASSEDDGSYSCRSVDAPELTHALHVNTNLALRNNARRTQWTSWPLLIILLFSFCFI